MIPLRDTIPSRTVPIVNYVLIVANGLVFFYELTLGADLPYFLTRYGVVPARFFNPHLFGEDLLGAAVLPLITFMFLHGGWFHFIGNMLYLWIFGDNVEDRIGHLRYLIFYVLCGLVSGLAQLFLYPSSQLPIVGASGAIAGVMGGYLLLYPFARVVTLFFFFFFVHIVEIPALFFLGFWFVFQFLSGSLSLAGEGGGVAWWAHIGGFLCGALLIFPLRKKGKQVIRRYH
jgi:membrane associated rhomboid family serine protease